MQEEADVREGFKPDAMRMLQNDPGGHT